MDVTHTGTGPSLPHLNEVGATAWAQGCLALARLLCPARPDGLVGYLLQADEFAELTGGTAFQPTPPSPPGSENFSSAADKRWLREQEGLATLKRLLVGSVPTEVTESCPGYHVEHGSLFLEPRALFGHVKNRERLATSKRYTEALQALDEPLQQGASVERYVAVHSAAHRTCELMGNPLNQEEKLRRFVRGVGGAGGPFALTLGLWEEQVAATPDQRTFEDGATVQPQVLLPTAETDLGRGKKSKGGATVAGGVGVPAYEGLATRVKRAAWRTDALGPEPGRGATTFSSLSPSTAQAPSGRLSVPLPSANLPSAAAVLNKRTNNSAKHKGVEWCDTHGHCSHATRDCRHPRSDNTTRPDLPRGSRPGGGQGR